MLVIPTWVAENGYIPPPWIVSHGMLGLLILKGQQIDLYPKTPSWLCLSVILSQSSGYSWMLGALIPTPIGMPTPREGWTIRSVFRELWSLPLVPTSTLPSMLRMSVPLLRPVINCIILSCLLFESIFLHALHPCPYIICSSGGLCYLCCSAGTFWAPCFCSLFHYSLLNDMVTFLHYLYGHFYLSCSACSADGAHHESYVPCISQGESFLMWFSSKE